MQNEILLLMQYVPAWIIAGYIVYRIIEKITDAVKCQRREDKNGTNGNGKGNGTQKQVESLEVVLREHCSRVADFEAMVKTAIESQHRDAADRDKAERRIEEAIREETATINANQQKMILVLGEISGKLSQR